MAKLNEIFGDFRSLWPKNQIKELPGIEATSINPDPWLNALNLGVTLKELRIGTDGPRSSFEAKAELDNAASGYSDGYPFVFTSMPDVEFRIPSQTKIKLFVSVSNAGAEVLIENMEVEIRLPLGFVEPPSEDSDPPVFEKVKSGAGVKVIYRKGNPTSIFTKIRLHVNEDLQVSITTAAPISFEKCKMFDLPMKAVHDFRLIPSPELAEQQLDWVRHSVEPWVENYLVNGVFAVTSFHFDNTKSPFKDLAKKMNGRSEEIPMAEFVLDDLVVPWYQVYVLPIPVHISIGIRKLFLEASQVADPAEYFAFENAPLIDYVNRDPVLAVIVNSFFFRSQPVDELDQNLGLSFDAGIVIGTGEQENADPNDPDSDTNLKGHVIKFGLGEQYLIYAGYQFPEGLKVLDIGGISLFWMGFKVGYSIGRHLEAIKKEKGAGAAVGDSLLATLDLMVTSLPEETEPGSNRFLNVRSLNGQKVKIILEGLGWKMGSFSFGESLKVPDGVAIWIKDVVALVFEEMGFVSESGAVYFSFSGGVLWQRNGFEGGITFKRLRFRIGGNPGAAPFKMDGFFIRLKNAAILIEAGGYYTEKEVAEAKVKEFALTGTIKFKVAKKEYLIGLDYLVGKLTSPTADYSYGMIQVFFRGTINICGSFAFTGARVIVVWNMQPKLDELDKESQDLRYYNWYKKSNPLTTGGDQRLRAWEANNESGAFGLGASVSFAGVGTLLEISLFGMGVWGPDENGFLFVGEVFILGSKKPVAWLALEWDGKNDRFAMVIGVDLKVSSFVKGAPSWMDDIASITGTLFICNDPATIAIGRLNDERTWFGLQFKYDVWVASAFFKFALCFEWVDGEIIGFGLVIRFEGGANFGILKVTFYLGFGVLAAFFKTGSSDFSLTIWLEGALRVILFGFLKFGISARLELRLIGNDPDHGLLKGIFRFETPWFLPDITWTCEHTWGGTDMDSLSTATAPLRKVAALTASKKTAPTFNMFFSPDWGGEGTAPLFPVKDLRTTTTTEGARLAAFAADTTSLPIPTDATIQIDWAVPVNDLVLPGPPASGDFAEQKSGDITLVYSFIGIRIRRRPRFVPGAAWTLVDEHTELIPDFSDPAGVSLNGSFSPSEISMVWDPSVKVAGKSVPKRLMINAKTPFEFITNDPESDEETVRDNPYWPCCPPRGKGSEIVFHRLWFRDDLIGTDVNGPRTFTESLSTWRFRFPALIRPAQLGPISPANTTVAFVDEVVTGLIGSADFDEDVGYLMVRMAWSTHTRGDQLKLVAMDATHEQEKVYDLPATSNGQFHSTVIGAPFPIRRLELRMLGEYQSFIARYTPAHNGEWNPIFNGQDWGSIEIDTMLYLTVEEYLDHLRKEGDCSDINSAGFDPYQGNGKIGFLPNHEYEISVTTRVAIAHPSDTPDPAEVTEYTYFRTKGLPGLNAVERVGEEVEPYVDSVYQGGKSLVYQEEPVAISFTEDFHVAVPLATRPPGAIDEHFTLMQMQLLVNPAVAEKKDTVVTATDDDWIVANRILYLEPILATWKSVVSGSVSRATPIVSSDPLLERLGVLTQRPQVNCNLKDPLDVIGTALIAPPQGVEDPENPGAELWPGNRGFVAYIKKKGSGYVNRQSFVSGDLTALDYAGDTAGANSANWSVTDGIINLTPGANREFGIFGENDWNHLSIQVGITLESGYAGIGVSLPAGNIPNRGLFAVVKPSGNSYEVEIIRRSSGTAWVSEDSMTLPEGLITEANPSLSLDVMAYDDIFRVTVGDQTIELQRNEFREGRLALVGRGNVSFHSLVVQGLDIYTFPFQVSRFRSFTDHIQSFLGEVDVADNSIMGAAASPMTVGALYTSMSASIQSSMHPDSDDKTRQEVFDQWVQSTGMPVKSELTELEISRYAEGNKTAFFLLESPEPLDFSEEISITVKKRVKISGGPVVIDRGPGLAGGLIDSLREFKNPPRRKRRVGEEILEIEANRKAFRDNLFFREEVVDNPDSPVILNQSSSIEAETVIRDLESSPDGSGLRVTLDKKDVSDLIFFEKEGDDDGFDQIRFFGGVTVEKEDENEKTIHTGPAMVSLAPEVANVIREAVAGKDKGVIGVYDLGKGDISIYWPQYKWVDVEVKVLQDGSRKKAVLIPVDGVNHKALSNGRYRFEFELFRRRWNSTEAPDALNAYEQDTSLTINIG